MKEILELERLGYAFSVQAGKVRYTLAGERPEAAVVRPLLDRLKERRAEAVLFLQARARQREVEVRRLEAELSSLIDAWQTEPDQGKDLDYARRYADLAIRLGFACYADDGIVDLGAAGWRAWAEAFGQCLEAAPNSHQA